MPTLSMSICEEFIQLVMMTFSLLRNVVINWNHSNSTPLSLNVVSIISFSKKLFHRTSFTHSFIKSSFGWLIHFWQFKHSEQIHFCFSQKLYDIRKIGSSKSTNYKCQGITNTSNVSFDFSYNLWKSQSYIFWRHHHNIHKSQVIGSFLWILQLEMSFLSDFHSSCCCRVLKMQTTNDLTLSNLTIKLLHLEKLKLWYFQNKTSSNSSTQSDNTTNSTSQEKIHPLLIFGLTCCPSLKSLELHDLHFVLSFLFFSFTVINFRGDLTSSDVIIRELITSVSPSTNFSFLSGKHILHSLYFILHLLQFDSCICEKSLVLCSLNFIHMKLFVNFHIQLYKLDETCSAK
jgi:hypothetical protein